MPDYPRGGLIGRSVHLYRRLSGLQIPLYAANACYFITLALFPALVLLLALLRRTPLDVEQLGQLLSGILPAAFLDEAEALILTTYDLSHSAFLGISALTALWAASRGIYGILIGLNAVYGTRESRGYLRTRFLSTLYTAAFLAVLLLTLGLQVFASELLQLLGRTSHPFVGFVLRIVNLRFFLLVAVQTLVFSLMFMFLPSRRNAFRESLPGALLASCGWLVFSNLFSVYVERFAGMQVYGPVSSLALGLLWLYFCMCILFYGGALNALLKKWE